MNQGVRKAARYVESKVTVLDDDNKTEFLGKNPTVPKVLVFSEKTRLPLMLKALSITFDEKLAIGFASKEKN